MSYDEICPQSISAGEPYPILYKFYIRAYEIYLKGGPIKDIS